MKSLASVLLGLCLVSAIRLCAASPDQGYAAIHAQLQLADRLVERGLREDAKAQYLKVQQSLEAFRKESPDWNPGIIDFRLRYVATKLEQLDKGTTSPPSPEAGVRQPGGPETGGLDELTALRQRVRQLEGEKELLGAKLKEALAARPAAVDPLELSRALDKVEALQREIGTLRTQLQDSRGQATERPVAAPATTAPDGGETPVQVEALKQELATLRETTTTSAATISALRTALTQAETEKQSLADRNRDLERRLADAGSAAAATTNRADSVRLPVAVGDGTSERFRAREELIAEIDQLRAQLGVLMARRVPYSAEELRLFRVPELASGSTATNRIRPVRPELPAGAMRLVAEAEREHQSRRFAEAEQKYAEALRLVPGNREIVSALAAVQLDQDRLEAAEQTLGQALAVDPSDPYCLSLLGRLRYHQGRPDEALALLSRSAQLAPSDADVFNLLGIVLSVVGLPGPSETAFRRALQLSPGNANVHYNLAVVCAAQEPPSLELARFHYQRALAAGHPRSPDLETRLDAGKPNP